MLKIFSQKIEAIIIHSARNIISENNTVNNLILNNIKNKHFNILK